ncbi:MAG TPA: hypothetical protein ENG78_07365 [Acidiferrobacteraceae bacterium]|nr:hypothetical protein [Acidiferrobacteraceae bacterium]HEX20619.1 hypothetical protein [Acidiferrobacteraceae bacterium]
MGIKGAVRNLRALRLFRLLNAPVAAAMRLFYSMLSSDGRETRNPVVIYITWWTAFVLLSSGIVPWGTMRKSVFW